MFASFASMGVLSCSATASECDFGECTCIFTLISFIILILLDILVDA